VFLDGPCWEAQLLAVRPGSCDVGASVVKVKFDDHRAFLNVPRVHAGTLKMKLSFNTTIKKIG